jgi:nitrogenase subunit NifH
MPGSHAQVPRNPDSRPQCLGKSSENKETETKIAFCGAHIQAKALGIDVLAEIPLISEVRQASDEGAPIATSKENPQTAPLFTDLAHSVIAQVVSRLLKGDVVHNTAQNNPKPDPSEEPMKNRRLSVL